MDNLEAIKRSVEVGFGISIAPRSAVVREMQAGTLCVVPVDAPDAHITSSYAQYAGRRLSAPARAFVGAESGLETLRPPRRTAGYRWRATIARQSIWPPLRAEERLGDERVHARSG